MSSYNFPCPPDYEMKVTEDALALAVSGDTAPIGGLTAGKYIFLTGHSTLPDGGYHVKGTDIGAGETLSASNIEADGEGFANALNAKVSELNSKTMQANETISDCNNAVNGRAYNFVSGALHSPDFYYGTLFQIGTMLNSSTYKMQIACDVVGNHIAFRRTPNDSWGNEPWNELALNSKITPEVVTGWSINTSVLPQNSPVGVVKCGNVIHVSIAGASPITSGANLVGITGLPIPKNAREGGYRTSFPWGLAPSANNIFQCNVSSNGSLYVNIGSDKPIIYIGFTYIAQ